MFNSSKELVEEQGSGFIRNGGPIQKKRSKTRQALPQIFATMSFGMLIFGVSTICVMPTIVLGSLLKDEKSVNQTGNNGNQTEISEIPMTPQQASWFGSIVYIAQPIGSVTSGFIQDTFGRRRCMMGVTIPQLIGWIILYFAYSVEQLFVATVIMGLSVGFMEAPAMSYLGEVCDPKLRGTLSSFSETFLLIGILFKFFMGAVLYWRYSCAAAAIIPVLTFICLYMVPESPTWYMMKGRTEDAETALRWLRGWVTKDEVNFELTALRTSVNQDYHKISLTDKSDLAAVQEEPKSRSEWAQIRLLLEPRIYKPIFLVGVFFFVGHCASLLGLRPFLVKIFRDLDLEMSPYLVLVLSGLLQLMGSITCSIFIHKLGKRIMSFLSMSGGVLSCFLLAIYIYCKVNITWIPVALFCFNFFCGGFGNMTLPWVLVCEIFPLEARGVSAGLSAAISYIFGFVVTKSYIDMENLIELPGVLIVYGIIGIMGIIFLYFRLPETEGKTLAEIELYFKK